MVPGVKLLPHSRKEGKDQKERKERGKLPLASNSRRGEETRGASTRWKAIFGPAVCQIGTMWEEGHGHSNCHSNHSLEEPKLILNRSGPLIYLCPFPKIILDGTFMKRND